MGPDYIHPRIPKEAADTLALPLFSLFSDSPSNGVIQAAWTSDIPTLNLKKNSGVWIASNFSFKRHHSLALKRGFDLLNMIKRTFPRISRDDFEQLYATNVRSLLEYTSSVVHTGLQTDIL